MPRPVLAGPDWAGAGDGRACQPAASAAVRITAARRASPACASRKATGSAPAAAVPAHDLARGVEAGSQVHDHRGSVVLPGDLVRSHVLDAHRLPDLL